MNLSNNARLQLRLSESKTVLDEFYQWIEEISVKTLPQSLLGKAITYAINQKEYLSNFLLDPRIQLSNNLAEQSIKMFVIGR
ncbi:MAG: IS66 family transposase, partial [Lachnospiraceae bacterium]